MYIKRHPISKTTKDKSIWGRNHTKRTGQRLVLLLSEFCHTCSISLIFHLKNIPKKKKKKSHACKLHNHSSYISHVPYLAYTLGCVPRASRRRIGVYGLCFFIVGYARLINVLHAFVQSFIYSISNRITRIIEKANTGIEFISHKQTNLVALLWSEVWQNRKRSSFRPLVKAYLERAIAKKKKKKKGRNERNKINPRMIILMSFPPFWLWVEDDNDNGNGQQ